MDRRSFLISFVAVLLTACGASKLAKPAASKPKEELTSNLVDDGSYVVFINDTMIGVASNVEFTKNYRNQFDVKGSLLRIEDQYVDQIFSKGFVNPHAQRYPLRLEAWKNNIPVRKINLFWLDELSFVDKNSSRIIIEQFSGTADSIK